MVDTARVLWVTGAGSGMGRAAAVARPQRTAPESC